MDIETKCLKDRVMWRIWLISPGVPGGNPILCWNSLLKKVDKSEQRSTKTCEAWQILNCKFLRDLAMTRLFCLS